MFIVLKFSQQTVHIVHHITPNIIFAQNINSLPKLHAIYLK